MTVTEESKRVFDQLIGQVIGVADLADLAFPGKNLGPSLKECADTIQEHLCKLSMPEKPMSLLELAENNCRATFQQLQTLKPGDADEVKLFEVLSMHARELFEILYTHEDPNKEDPADFQDRTYEDCP